MSDFYIISVKHSQRRHRYITFWRPENKGYAWPLSWAGKYSEGAVLADLDYYNRGDDTIAVPCDFVEAIAVSPVPGTIDNDAGPVVLNTPHYWRALMLMAVAEPANKPKPEAIYFGRNAA